MLKPKPIKEAPIQIFSIYKINDVIENQGRLYSHCISIFDPNENLFSLSENHSFQKILTLKFHDISTRADMTKDMRPLPPNRRLIKKIVNFYSKTSDIASGYTIHCHAGVHRSVATGLIGFYLMRQNEKWAMNELLKIKALPLPNKKMISLFDQMYDTNLTSVTEELYTRCRDFLESRIEINRDDYLDELDVVEE